MTEENTAYWLGRTVYLPFERRHATVIAASGSGFYDCKLPTGEVVSCHVSGMVPTGRDIGDIGDGDRGEGAADE